MKLLREFYIRDTLSVARDLIGKTLVTNKDGKICKGIIVETEAYLGKNDKACHSYKNNSRPADGLRSSRTNVMYGEGGYSYVYLIYGMHYCFNVVSSGENIPEAVLIRAVEPVEGIDVMMERRGFKTIYPLCSGPGKLCAAFAINKGDYGADLCGDIIWIEDNGDSLERDIAATRRINVDYAGEDSLLPYRFIDKNSRFLSKFKV